MQGDPFGMGASQQPGHSLNGPNWKYISPNDLPKELDWPSVGSQVPECWQGIWFLDQNYLSWPILNDTEYTRKANVYGRDFTDYASCVENKWDGNCITFGYVGGTTYGYDQKRMETHVGCPAREAGHDTTMCMERPGGDPCALGVVYQATKTRETFGYLQTVRIKKTRWGWDRETEAVAVSALAKTLSPNGTDYYHYPVVRIVDPQGRNTKFFNTYMREATNDFDCDLEGTSELSICPKNDLANGVQIICTTRA
jgi:hypothetical protein